MPASVAFSWPVCIRASPTFFLNRLSFYENWLDARGLRLGTIGVAPLTAVLSFLRQEGDAYGVITRRAGEYAAEWTDRVAVGRAADSHQGLAAMAPQAHPAADCASIGAQQLPRQPRHREVHGRAAPKSILRASIFCSVREPVAQTAVRLYAAAVQRLMELLQHRRTDRKSSPVVATGESTCLVLVALNGSVPDTNETHP